ncbi:hypothetical protein [Streptomyces sp. HSG2]|uniref:hypothetical protein n=1 Tax=Streptomyces sp. HSG2 TaxID=2797167 RepID=UPI0019035683|nr:hypothetical protein [Streptomyces sp. HSG2]
MVDDAFTGVEGRLGVTAACRLTGRSRATHYRRLQPPPPRRPRSPRVQPAALTAEERAAVLELMNRDEYAELPPAQIWARELDAGRYQSAGCGALSVLSSLDGVTLGHRCRSGVRGSLGLWHEHAQAVPE